VHQLFDQLLADRSILLARKFCDRLRDRDNHFASPESTLSDPPAGAGYSTKKSSISSTIMQ
jgi:hypothetical protein